MTIPGVQYPHWSAWFSRNASCTGCNVPSGPPRPSIVTISVSSACAASSVHDFTDSPLSSTVQAPHELVSHPMFVPVRPRVSRRYCTRSSLGSTSCWRLVPFTCSDI